MATQRIGKTQQWILVECLKRGELTKVKILSEYFGLQKSYYKYSGEFSHNEYFAGYHIPDNVNIKTGPKWHEACNKYHDIDNKRNKAQVSLYRTLKNMDSKGLIVSVDLGKGNNSGVLILTEEGEAKANTFNTA
jgi:hypothetical protein